MDINELLSRSWKTTWNHKNLWGFGFLSVIIGLAILPLMVLPLFALFLSDGRAKWVENPLVWLAWLLLFALLMVASYVVSPITRAAIILGLQRVAGGAEKLSFRDLLRASLPFFGRFFGLMLLYAAALLLVNTVLSGVQLIASVLTMGMASLCLTPLSLLVYPLLYAGAAWLELAEVGLVVDGLDIRQAVQRGWDLMRQNLMNVLLVGLVLYLGIGLLAVVLMLPMLLPFMILPLVLIESEGARSAMLLASVCLVGYLPVFAFIQGVIIVFMKACWYQVYVRFSGQPADVQAPLTARPSDA